MIELDTIYNEDCLEGMKRIPDGSVDAVICDLPYGVLNAGSEGGTWDVGIPFKPLWEQYKRVTKPNAAIVLFSQGMFTAKLMMSQPKMWRYNLVWDKLLKSGFLNANRMPLRQHEDIVVFYRELPVYNPQMIKVPPHRRNHSRGDMQKPIKNRCYGNFVETPTIISDEKFPSSIITFAKQHINGKSYHPTEKPLDLIRYLVLTYTNSGWVILDNCIVSGTTAIACLKERRHFIGFELNKEYYDKACKRIREEQRQLKFDFEE